MGGAQQEVTPPENPKGAFLPCAVNGVKSQALLDTGAEATIISEDLYSRSKTPINKLEPTQKPVLGANNMPLDVVGKTEVTIQLGGIRAPHEVLVCRGLAQQVLIGIDFLTTHKCIINFDTNTVYSKGEPNKMMVECLDKVYRITVAETVTLSPNMVADIPCEVQGVDGLDECMGVLEPADTFSEKYCAGVFRMAVTVKGGRIPVRVFNCFNKPLKLYRCSSIGDLYPLAGKGESQQEINRGVGYKVVPPGVPKEDVEVRLEAKQCSAVFVKDADVHSLSVEEMFPISSNLVPEEEKLRLYEMLSTYADCISKGPWDLGTAKGVQHTINTGSAQPIQVPPRRVPFHKRQEMRSQVDEMLEAKIIEPSDSPWSSPVVLVAKPDGSQRFCVDYRAVNSVTRRDLYPLPRCVDILESLSGAQWFSHLDLLRGYWQIDVAEGDREKTAFATPDGLYQFRKLSFGLTNAPACFMRAMHLILKGLCWSDCLVYLDDIIVFGRTLQEHRERLSLVLSRLTEAGLKINPKKCKLLCEQVVVLGHVVSGEGISTDPEKIRVIKEWPVPADESQLKAFLGTAGYYRQFVPNYAHIASPLHRACQKGDRFTWTAECQEAFLHIKNKLTNAPILAFPKLDVPFILDSDASDGGLGAVLSQVQYGRERVIAYAARALSKAERNYSTTRKELLALLWGTERFETFLYGRRFLVRTDHSALQWLRNFKNPRGQVARWVERLNDFDFEVEHRPGQLHGNADGLSRFPWEEDACEKIETDATLIQSVNMGPLSTESIQAAQNQDPVLSQVVKWLETGVRPARGDVEGGGRKLLSYWSQWGRLFLRDGLVCRRWEHELTGQEIYHQICLPESIVSQVLGALHNDPSSGHLGVSKTLEKVRRRFYWHGMREDVEMHVRRCVPCAEVNDPPKRPKAPLINIKAGHPLQRVALDIVGPTPRSTAGHEWLLVVSDHFTKFAQAFPVKNTSAVTLAKKVMDEYMCRFGCFEGLHSDQGANVDGAVFKGLCDLIEAAKTRTTPYHPQGDGQVERLNKSLVKILSKLISDHRRDWADFVPKAVLAYNTSVHESTGFTPYRLMFGREAILPLDALLGLETTPSQGVVQTYPDFVVEQKQQLEETEQIVRENLKRAQKLQKAYYDTKSHGQPFRVGDRVWYRNRTRTRRKKFIKPWCGPWKVLKALSDVTYRIEKERRRPGKRRQRKVVHFNYLKPCFSPPESHEKTSQLTSSSQAEETPPTGNLRDARRPTRGTLPDSGDVELEWLENPAATVTEVAHTPQEHESSSTLGTSPQTAEVPCQSGVSLVNNEQGHEACPVPMRPRRERREPVWLQDYVRTVVVYPTWPLNFVGTFACYS